MQGQIDVSYQTLQRDLFASGMAAQIGMNAFGVWLAIKSHADYNTGRAWPGMRRLATVTGLSLGSVSKSVRALVEARLLRVLKVAKGKSRRGSTYIARERMEVKLGDRVLCTIVLDYIPATLHARLHSLDQAVKTGKGTKDVFAQCEMIPGDGFVWHEESGSLRAAIPAREVPLPELVDESERLNAPPAVRRVLAIQRRGRSVPLVERPGRKKS